MANVAHLVRSNIMAREKKQKKERKGKKPKK
jgi:hypothetical protein